MKLYYFLLLVFSLTIIGCKKEKVTPFFPQNYLADFSTEKSQVFDLDTLSYQTIIGRHGTKINYSRDLFDLKENEKVQLELTELYDFKEILYRNIQTLTTDNHLLETSGVLKIVFTSNGKKLNLKKGEKIIVYPPEGKLENNEIFLSKKDSLDAIKWEITNQDYARIEIYKGGGIYVSLQVLKDSLPYYEKKWRAQIDIENQIKNYFVLETNSWNWINIDHFVKDTPNINFKLKEASNRFEGFSVYIVYDNLDSFINYTIVKDNLNLLNIPITPQTHLIIVGQHKGHLYYDKLDLNQSKHNKVLDLQMKRITKEDLKNLFHK